MGVQPLIFFSPGAKGKIYAINGGKTFTKRLSEMGFKKGQKIEVIKNDAGPIIVGLNSSRVALGRGMAQRIMANPLES